TWIDGVAQGAGYLLDLAYGDGQFAIWGNSNQPYPGAGQAKLSTSTDGLTWATHVVDATNTLEHLTMGNGKFVAVGGIYNRGFIASSSDGVTWRDHSDATSNKLYGVAFCNDRFVAVGNYGNILTSADGETWQRVNSS